MQPPKTDGKNCNRKESEKKKVGLTLGQLEFNLTTAAESHKAEFFFLLSHCEGLMSY